jgi:tetratricopeptide (TPR) repeat protein
MARRNRGAYSAGARQNDRMSAVAARPIQISEGASMSRRRDPRRFRLALGAACLALAGLALPAVGQTTRDARSSIAMRTMIGGHRDARACQQAAASERPDGLAIAACDRALSADPVTRRERAALLFARGVMRIRRQEERAALADFDAALAIMPEQAETHVNRAAALAALGDYGAAVAAITLALSYGVREPYKAYFNRGAAREALGDLRGALEDYSTALEIRPDWGRAEAEIARFARSRQERLAQVLGGERAGDSPAPAVR